MLLFAVIVCKNESMSAVGILGLLLTLAFAIVAFGAVVNLNTDISGLTTGAVQSLAGALPAFWMILVGFVGVAGVILAAAAMFR